MFNAQACRKTLTVHHYTSHRDTRSPTRAIITSPAPDFHHLGCRALSASPSAEARTREHLKFKKISRPTMPANSPRRARAGSTEQRLIVARRARDACKPRRTSWNSRARAESRRYRSGLPQDSAAEPSLGTQWRGSCNAKDVLMLHRVRGIVPPFFSLLPVFN